MKKNEITKKDTKKPIKSQKKKRSPMKVKQRERRKKVKELICSGYKNYEIADILEVDEKTIRKDIKFMFSGYNEEEEKRALQESIRWSIKKASIGYNNAKTETDQRKWLGLKCKILYTMTKFLKETTVNIENVNVQNNLIYKLKRLQDAKTEEEVDTILKAEPVES